MQQRSSADIIRQQQWAVARARALRLLNRYDENQPRDEGGKWTSGGGSGGGGEGSATASTGAGAGRAGKPSVAYGKRSPSDAERVRGVVNVFEPSAASREALSKAGVTPITYQEMSSAGAGRFHDAIAKAKQGKYAAAVTVYPQEDYADMRTFLSDDGKAGFALKGDDIVSVFKDPGSDAKEFATTALGLATAQGGRRLDAFDTVLPSIYANNGFRAVARIPWNDEYQPEGWSKETFKAFNGGSPDVVFMTYDPANAGRYRPGDGAKVEDYDAGIAAQQAAIAKRKSLARIRYQQIRVARARALQLLEFDPNQPRDETGKWTSDGGGGAEPAKPSGPKAGPKVSSRGKVSAEGVGRVQSAIAALPAAHAEAIKNVPITLVPTKADVESHGLEMTVGLYRWDEWGKPLGVQLVEKIGEGEISAPISNLESVALHEMGHAVDHHNGWESGHVVWKQAKDEARKGMTLEERKNAAYFLDTPREAFAELYALAHNPVTVGSYFGGLPRTRAREVFSGALEKIKTISISKSARSYHVLRAAKGLVENGWFVTTEGRVYAIVNGSAYEVDAKDTPLAKLPPGNYTNEEAEAELNKQKQQSKSTEVVRSQQFHVARTRSLRLLERFDPDQPRDETGKWTSGGGGADEAKPAAAATAPKPAARPRLEGRLRGSNPSIERVNAWEKQLTARDNELEKQGLFGGQESDNLHRMSGALSIYARAKEGILPGPNSHYSNYGANFIYTTDDEPKLEAACATKYDAEKKVAQITDAGGVTTEAYVAAVQDATIRCQSDGAKRVETNIFADDEQSVSVYEQCGFKRGGETAGVVTYYYGEATTAEEVRVEKERGEKYRAEKIAMVNTQVAKVAKDLDFDAGKISISENDGSENFTLNGQQMKAAGIAYTGGSVGPHEEGTIRLFPSQMWGEEAVKGTTAHEIKHIKFQEAMNRFSDERRAAVKDPAYLSEGWREVSATKYPAYALMDQAFSKYTPEEFGKTDGVSNYSAEYWKRFEGHDTAANYRSAMHETLAEMARIKYTTGKFPNHVLSASMIQDEWLAYEEGNTLPLQHEKEAGTKRWRALYNAVEQIYQIGRSK